MPDLPIASAATLTGANTASGDLFPLLDVSAPAGSKGSHITRDELGVAIVATSAVSTALGGKLAAASNLSDVADAATARTNLGLGTAATTAATDYATATHASTHVNGTDDIQDATAAQKGLATAAQIAKLDGIEALADVTDAGNVGSAISGASAVTSLGDTDKLPVTQSGVLKNIAYSAFKTLLDALYQAKATVLTTFGNLANASGVLTNNGSGTLSYTATSGSGSVALTTSPTFVTPALGAATATSVTSTSGSNQGTLSAFVLSIADATKYTGMSVAGVEFLVSGNIVTIAPPASLPSGSYTLTLPTTDGTSGQYLKTDGSGVTSWDTPGGSGDALVANTLDQFADVTQTAGQTLAITSSTTLAGGSHSGTNSGDVTLAGTPDYITISGQTITRAAIDLATDVTGALPIANGGTGQTAQTAAFDALAPTTTKGDLIVHNGTDNIRVAVGGTNGHVLTVDSAEASGVKWAAASGGGGGLTNITETLHTSSPNNTVNVEALAVTGGSTNTDLLLTPKGTGAFILGPPPDNGLTGGNKRGTYAVDLQMVRDAAARVASGNYSLAAGLANTASGSYAVAMGYQNFATGQSSGAGGMQSTASQDWALAWGYQVTASGYNAQAFGRNGTVSGTSAIAAAEVFSVTGNFAQGFGTYVTASGVGSFARGISAEATRYGQRAEANGNFSNGASPSLIEAQSVSAIARCKTTTNSAVEMFLDGSSARYTIPSGRVFSGTINIVGVKSDGSAVARYLRQVTIKNASGTTALVGSVITLGTDEAAGTTISITADDTNDSIKIEPTGITSETWRWQAVIQGAEITYGN